MSSVLIVLIICWFLSKVLTSPVGIDKKRHVELSCEIVKKTALEIDKDYKNALETYELSRKEALEMNNPLIEQAAFIELKKFSQTKAGLIEKDIEEFRIKHL